MDLDDPPASHLPSPAPVLPTPAPAANAFESPDSMPSGDDIPFHAWPIAQSHRQSRYQVVIQQTTLDELHAHGQRDTTHEICGILVGNLCRDAAGPYLLIDAMIEGNHASSRNTQVTFTAQTWTHVQDLMETRFADRRIVGWYHTHPDFGVFLSDMDLFLHGNFFNLPWQVALVYDPIRREEGLFVWHQGQTRREDLLIAPGGASSIVTNRAPATVSAAAEPVTPPILSSEPLPAAPAKVLDQQPEPDKPSRSRHILMVIVLFLASGMAYIFISSGGLEIARNWLLSLQPHHDSQPAAPVQP